MSFAITVRCFAPLDTSASISRCGHLTPIKPPIITVAPSGTRSAAAAHVRLFLTRDLFVTVGDCGCLRLCAVLHSGLDSLAGFANVYVFIEAIIGHQAVQRAFIKAIFFQLRCILVFPEDFADVLYSLKGSEDRERPVNRPVWDLSSLDSMLSSNLSQRTVLRRLGPIKHDRLADMCDFKLSHRIRQARPTGLRLLGRRSLWIARDHSRCSAVSSHTVEPANALRRIGNSSP